MSDKGFVSGLLNAIIREDLSDYDTVVNLDIKRNDGDVSIFVEKNGDGKILGISKDDFDAQKHSDGVSLHTVEDLRYMSGDDYAKSVAVAGAKVIMDNYLTYSGGDYEKLPFDKADVSTAKVDDLSEIKIALENIRMGLYSGSMPTQKFTEDGDFDGLEVSDNLAESSRQINDVDVALDNIELSLSAGNTLNSLKQELDNSNFTFKERGNIDYELNDPNSPAVPVELNAAIP